jgi:ACT domain-containing protein
MTSRFFTVEDLRRAGGREVVLAEGTVATPQALEAARSAGITIRGPAGPYTEPLPDRGPDAHRAAELLPHLPEPVDDLKETTGLVVTVIGRNRAGVVAEVSATLAEASVNILDISQKMVEGYFHLVLLVEAPPGTTFDEVKQRLECLGGPDDYVVRVMHERVFRFMHRI